MTDKPEFLPHKQDYVVSSRTDVTVTWRKYGWVPPCQEAQRAAYRALNPLNLLQTPAK